MLRYLLIISLFLSFGSSSWASHIVGGEIYYDYLGNNQYKFYIAIYRDCASSGAPFDDPLSLGVFSGGNLVQNVSVPFPGSTTLPIVFTNPCVTAPSGICTERAIYTITLTLPPTPNGYSVSYQRCCRGPAITNLLNPDDTGLTLEAFIPGSGSNFFQNSSPRFTNYPPLVICNNENLNFDHSATDPDGDSLSYQLIAPNAGANSINPQPSPPPAPIYPLVTWGSGFSTNQPLGAGSTTTINPVTGQLFVDANLTGLYVVGIRVNEYRNGVLIGSTTRDFLFRVVNCVIQLQAIVTDQEDTPGFIGYCNGLTFTFENTSYGASSYYWDFGVVGSTTDNSTLYEPTFTFPAPGTYQVMMIANPGWPCTDTAFVEVILDNPFNVDMTFQDTACFINNSTDFTAVVTGPPSTVLNWNFGSNAVPSNATGTTVNNVNFTNPNGNVIKLVGTSGVCADSVTYPIVFLNPPVATVGLPTNYECNGFTQSFSTNTASGATYLWDFGIPGTADQSTVPNPTFTFPGEGTYPITLITEIAPGCSDTATANITVYTPLDVQFTHLDSLCITNSFLNFQANVTGPSIATYTWNFGAGASPATSNQLNVPNVSYSSPGLHTISLTGSFLQCSETATSTVFLFKEPEIGFELKDALRCAPHTAHFVSTSSADTEILYFWDFGDGGTSNEENPNHVYLNPGQYTVTLKIVTVEGCVDTLVETQVGIVVVHPNPVADFTVDIVQTDICNADITFTDHSIGALTYFYWFDDGDAVSTAQNPVYTYTTAGTHYPIQIVKNEFLCQDTARQKVMIEPFPIYIPNTFTPDGNMFNNVFQAVLALEPIEWKMEIFNRWGELLFETTEPYDYWDGTYKGTMVQDGTYAYKVVYKPCGANQEEQIITGHVNLLR